LNPLVLVIVGVGVLGGGYLLVKYEQTQTPAAKAAALVSSGISILKEDPISVVSVYGDAKKYGGDVVNDLTGWL
jgi:hypothetical protein